MKQTYVSTENILNSDTLPKRRKVGGYSRFQQGLKTSSNLFFMKTSTQKSSAPPLALQAHRKLNEKRFSIRNSALLLFLFLAGFAFAQGTYTTTGAGNAWATAANWTPTPPSGGPTTLDNVIILHNMNGPTSARSVNNVTVQANTLTLASNVAFTVNGNVAIDGGTLNLNQSTFVATGTTTINSGGTITDNSNNGTATFTGVLTVNLGGTLSNTSTSAMNINGGGSNSGTINITGAANFTIGSGQTFTNNSTATFAGPLMAADASSTWINANGSTLNINNAASPMATPVVGVLNASVNANTVNYGATVAQSIRTTNYWNLSTSGTGNKSTFGSITVLNDLTINGGTLTRDASNTSDLNVEGATSIAGTTGIFNHATAAGNSIFKGLVTVTSTATTPITSAVGGTIEFQNGINATGGAIGTLANTVARFTTNDQTITGTPAFNFRDVIIGAGVNLTYNSSGNLSVNSILNGLDNDATFTLAANRTISYSGASIPMAIGLINASATGSTFNYSLNGAQTVKPTILPYYNLSLSGGGNKTFSPGETFLVNGNLSRTSCTLVTTGSSINMQGTDNATINHNTVAQTYNNLTINKPGATVTLVTVGNSTISNLNVSSGTLNFGTTAVNITVQSQLSGSAGTLDLSSAAHILTLNSSANSIQNFVGGTSSTVTYNSATDQNIFSSANYNNVTINGGGIKRLSGAFRCVGTFNFAGTALVDLGNNNLKLGPTAVLTGSSFSSNKMFLTDGEGAFVKEGNPSQIIAGLPLSTIPIANSRIIPLGNTGSPSNLFTPMYFTGGVFTGTASVDPYFSVRAVPNRQPNVPFFNNALIKYWDVQAVNITGVNTSVAFEFTNGEVVGSVGNYQIRVYNPITASLVIPNSPSPPGAQPRLRSDNNNFLTGQWTAVNPTVNTTLYTYQSGDWSNINVWTTDASGTTLIPPPNVPSIGDNVVILNGRTITTAVPRTVATVIIENNGVLDLGTTTTNDLGIVSGQGKLRISSNQFPAGTYTSFVSSTGGTVEFYNLPATSVLPVTQTTFNNLQFTNSSSTSYTAQLNANFTVNGNLETFRSGTGGVNFQFGTNTTARTLTVLGDVNVGTGTTISVVTAAANHTFTIHGNMNIDGTVTLSNNAAYAAAGGSGTALIRFFGATSNTTLTCNASSDVTFHQFQVTKNEGFELYASSSASSTVRFWGGGQTLNITLGTLRLGPNIVINRLNNGGNYDLGGVGSLPVLWIDGATVYAGNADAMVLFGTLKVTAGLFDAGSNPPGSSSQNAIVPRESGTMEIHGGVVNCKTFRVSNTSSQHRGAYIQTGGTFNASSASGGLGGVPSIPPFSLVYPDNVFIMSGGTLNVELISGNVNGFIVNSLPQNVEVTGGTVNFIVNSASNFGISTTSPLFNVNIRRNGGAGTHFLGALSWDLGSGNSGTAPARPLTVLGNFSLVSGNTPVFNANASDVTIFGDMNVQTATTFNGGTGTLWFNGTSNQTLTINGSLTPGSIGLNKPNTEVFVSGANTFQANGGLNILSGTLNDNGKILSFRGNIYNDGVHTGAGRIVLNGTATAQTIEGSGTYNNIDLSNTTGATGSVQYTANSNINVSGNLTMTTDRIFNLQNFRLGLAVASQLAASPGAFSANRHIRTSGLLSDGGIAKPFNNLVAFVYPFGTAAAGYTPATVKFNSNPTSFGTIDIRPVTNRQLYVTSTDCFEYYWKVKTTGTSGIVPGSLDLTFNYGSLADNTSYIPSFYNFNTIAYQTINDVNKVVEASKNILFENWSLLDGDFTAGAPSAFGIVVPFYSRATGAWENPSTWSNSSHVGPAASTVPDGNKPVFIGLNHTVTVNNNNTQSGSLIVESNATLDLGTSTGHNFGALPFATAGGAGRIRISSTTPTAQFPAGDFGLFFLSGGGTTEYYSLSGGVDFSIPLTSIAPTNLNIATYNNLVISAGNGRLISMPNRNLEVFGAFTTSGLGRAYFNQAIGRTVRVNGNINIQNGGLLFGSAANQILEANNDFTISTAGIVEVENVGTANHTIRLDRSLTNNGIIEANQSSKVNLVFRTSNNASLTGTNNFATTNLAGLTMNKGTGQGSILTVDVAGGFSAPSNAWLNLQNGTLRFNKGATITVSDQASSYLIPSSAKFEVNNTSAVVNFAMANSGASDLVLEGSLEVINGTVNVGNVSNNQHNDLEYAPTATPTLIIRNNSVMNINGQLRRSVFAFAGSLDLRLLNNSTLLVRGRNPDGSGSNNLNRAKFELLNNSNFVMENTSTLIIDRNGQASGIFGDIQINPATSSITGGEVIIGTANTPSGTQANFTSNIISTLNNLTIDGSVTDKTLNLGGNPLVLNSNLTINGNSIFNTNGQNVTIGGNLVNNNTNSTSGLTVGGFRATTTTQVTTFNSATAPQSISGVLNNLTNFANVVFNNTAVGGAVNLSANTNIRVNNALSILAGNFGSGANNVDVVGNIIHNTTHTSSGVGRVALIGSNQTIGGNGNGVFDNVRLVSGSGSEAILTAPLRINGTLTFVSGNFYLNNNQLTLGPNAVVAGSFSTSSMIRLNGVLSDGGVRKLYPASPQDFTFPIGVTMKYAPVRMNVTANSNAGDITVKPVNAKHPATTDPTENQLNFYWNVGATGFGGGTTVTHVYNYNEFDVAGDESNYRAGRYFNNVWTPQFGIPSTVNSSTNQITLSGVNYFNGDYTAGIQSEFDQLLVYYSRNATSGGNWTDPSSWSTDQVLQHAGPAASVPPVFNTVVIANGHTIVGNTNNLGSPTAIINGTLNLNNTFGHNFGTVSGTGTIRMTPNGLGDFIFPAGNYSTFTSAGGGTVEFFSGGASNLPSQSTFNNVTFSGIGNKSMFNTDYNINGTITINAGIVTNTFSRNISLSGNFVNNAGPSAFVSNTGTVFLNGLNQLLSGSAINFHRLTVNNGGNKNLDGITINVTNQLTLNNGRIVTGTGLVSIPANGTITGANANSYVAGNLQRFIAAATISRSFPIGDINQFTPCVVNFIGTTNGSGNITMNTTAGDHPNAGTSGLNPSKSVNRFFTLLNSGVSGFTSYSLTMNYPSSDVDGPANPLLFKIKRFSSGVWNDVTPGTMTALSSQASGLSATQSGDFYLAEELVAGLTWTGAISTDWNNPLNWLPNFVPTASDNVNIPLVSNQPTFLTTPLVGAANDITLANNVSINVPSGYTLNVSGNWNAASNNQVSGNGIVRFLSPSGVMTGSTTFFGVVTIATGANLNTNNGMTLANNSALMHGAGTPGAGGSISGGVTIRRTGSSLLGNYNYWSSPITNANMNVIGSANRFLYNPLAATGTSLSGLIAGWQPASGTMTVGRGYISTGAGTVSFNGTPNNGSLNYGPLVIGTFSEFNLVGNPYPSGMKATDFVAANPHILGGALYFWDDDGSQGSGYSPADYGTWNVIGFVGPNSGQPFNGNIASCQSFFVRAANTNQINFTNSMRTAVNNEFFDVQPIGRIWLSVNDNQNKYNETLIAFKDDATDGFDQSYDAAKLKSPSGVSLYSKIGNEDFAIQAMAELTTDKLVPLGIETNNSGAQTLALKNTENLDPTVQIILEDTKTGVFHNMKSGVYNYTFDASNDVNRFRLHLKPAVQVTTTAESCVQNDATITINSPSATTWNYQVKNAQNMTVSFGEDFSGIKQIPHLAGGNYSVFLNNNFGVEVIIPVSIAAGSPVSVQATVSSNTVEANTGVVNFAAQVNGATDYTWNFGDGTLVSGTLNPSHVYTAPGTYEVTFIASNAFCMETITFTIVVKQSTVGIAQMEEQSAFSIYPNPVVDIANIRVNMPQNEEKLTLYVLDAAGRLVKSEVVNKVDRKSTIQINLSELASGTYQVMLIGKQFSANGKLNLTK